MADLAKLEEELSTLVRAASQEARCAAKRPVARLLTKASQGRLAEAVESLLALEKTQRLVRSCLLSRAVRSRA